jgi:hypothetical protein
VTLRREVLPVRFYLPIFVTILAAITACATLKSAGTAVKNAVIDCGKQALQEQAADLFPDVQTILAGGSLNWAAELDELGKRGLEALACAVAKVGVALAESGSAKPTFASVAVTPADRASQYLMSRGFQVTNVK